MSTWIILVSTCSVLKYLWILFCLFVFLFLFGGGEIIQLQILRPILHPFLFLERWLLWISISPKVVIFLFFIFPLIHETEFALLFVKPKPMACKTLSHNFNNLCQFLLFLNSSFSFSHFTSPQIRIKQTSCF